MNLFGDITIFVQRFLVCPCAATWCETDACKCICTGVTFAIYIPETREVDAKTVIISTCPIAFKIMKIGQMFRYSLPHFVRYISNHRPMKNTTVHTLHWRHNDHHGVSNHQPHGCQTLIHGQINENIKAPRHFVRGIHRDRWFPRTNGQ